MSLEDLDGSESLWVWVTPYAYEADGTTVSSTATSASEFSFGTGSLASTRYGTDGDAFVVKGSDLDEVSVSRDASYLKLTVSMGCSGSRRFRWRVRRRRWLMLSRPSSGVDGTDYAVQSAT